MVKKTYKTISQTALVPRVPRKLWFTTISVLILMISAASFGVVFYAYANPGLTYSTIIEEGSMMETASYVIFKDGSTYYAKNGSTGAIDYLSSDATTVIESVLNASTSGGRIFIRRGTYEIDTTINVYNKYITIIGEGPGSSGTRLQLSNNADCNMFNLNSSTFFYLYELSLDGNKNNNNAGIGVSASPVVGGLATADITIDRVFIHNFAEEGVYWTDCWGSVIKNSYIEANLGNGSQIGGWNNHLISTTFNWNNGSGIRIGGDYHVSVVDCAICENGEHGIYVSGGSTTIADNKILGNGVITNDTYSGIYIYGGNTHSITGNLIDGRTIKNPPRYNTSRHGIRVENCVNGTTITGNTIVRTLSPEIYTAVSDKTHIENNIGFITERGGTSEASNDDWIDFGVTFAGTPQCVVLTVQESDARYIAQVKSKNTTHAQLYLYDETAGSLESTDKTVSWYAEYKP